MRNARVAWPLLLGWFPIAVLFTALIVTAHGGPVVIAAFVALRMVVAAAVLGVAVHQWTTRHPWPHPFRARFLLVHVGGAAVYAIAWLVLNSAIESLLRRQLVVTLGPGVVPYLVLGIWLYVMIAGVAYASRAAARTAELEAIAARTQLAALRAQLHPHFLFNALHTVVQLIPVDPAGAARAAELLAEALRVAIDERRDLVPLRDELAFVRRYLALESIRFGPRLVVEIEVEDDVLDLPVPAFALQTLVENAVRHGAAPLATPTTLRVDARRAGGTVEIVVADTGAGADPSALLAPSGSGLTRLRERLHALYGGAASLDVQASVGGGCRAALALPASERAGPR
jgi:signal transduction histidine kinase